MNLIRLVVLGVLFYILYRLLFGPPKKKVHGPAAGHIQDVLKEDPVCHTYVPASQAIILKHKGTTEHFCSEKCRDEFLDQRKKNNAAP